MFKVVWAEILPRDFLGTLGNNHLLLTIAKIERLKKFHFLEIRSIFKGFDCEIISFQEQKELSPRDFNKVY